LSLSAAGKRFSGDTTASLYNDYAGSVRTGSYLNAAGTILGGVSTMATRYNRPSAEPQGRYGPMPRAPLSLNAADYR
jgi:hypothetical protein